VREGAIYHCDRHEWYELHLKGPQMPGYVHGIQHSLTTNVHHQDA
jgi:hypothetical protein